MSMNGKKAEEDDVPVTLWHTMTVDEALKELGLDPEVKKTGLTTAQAEAALAK